MTGKFTVAAVSVAAVLTLGACSRGDNSAYDSTAGSTAGAMATPPATTTPYVGTSTGAIGLSTGASTSVLDTTKKSSKKKP